MEFIAVRIISMVEAANRANQSLRTLQRQIAEGNGPAVFDISERRRGILESDFEEWLLTRRRPGLEPAAPKRGRGRPRKTDHPIPEAPRCAATLPPRRQRAGPIRTISAAHSERKTAERATAATGPMRSAKV